MNGKTCVEPRTYAVAKVWKCSLCSRLVATIENRLADPVSLSGRQCTSSVLLKGLFGFLFLR